MLAGGEQRLDDREALRRHREAAVAASLGELGQALGGIGAASSFVYQL